MNTKPFSKETCIHQSFSIVCGYLSDPIHLTAWTHFFKSLVRLHEGFYEFDTLMGKSQTRIVRTDLSKNQSYLEIKSIIKKKEESANLIVTAKSTQETQVVFTLNLPEVLSVDQQNKMLISLEDELTTLKCLLEELPV